MERLACGRGQTRVGIRPEAKGPLDPGPRTRHRNVRACSTRLTEGRKTTRVITTFLCVVFVGAVLSFWGYRGSEVFFYALGDFSATPYTQDESGRELLERVSAVSTKVEWTLSNGDRQVAYYIPPRTGRLIIYAHGSPGNGLGMYGGEARRLVERGYGALLVDLPGYGASEGDRTWGVDFVETMRLAVDFASAQTEVDSNRIAGFGYSNGGCLIARAAAEDDRLSAIVLLASYTRLAEQLHFAFKRRVPGMGYFAIAAARWRGVPVEDLDTVAALEKMDPRPTLIVSGGRDHAIALVMHEQIKSVVPGTEAIIYPNADHLDFVTQAGPAYIDALDDFYDRALKPDVSVEVM